MLHFSLDWRKVDLDIFKPINLDVVGIDSFIWFEYNTFTLEMSHTILNLVERSLKGEKASKNNKDLVFVIPFIFEMPTALALTLCELHRRQMSEKEKYLITSRIQTYDLRMFLGRTYLYFRIEDVLKL